MTQKKDDLCDGINFQNTLEKLQVMDERNQPLSLKRHRTNGTQNTKEEIITREMINHTTNSRTYTNSNSNITDNKNFQRRKSQTNDINDSNNKHYDNRENRENPFHISYQALTYTAATHLQPIKLECVSKMNDQKEAAKFIQHFFKFIENNFYQPNNYHDRPTGFDQW
ncbi:unnamed protein product [Rotaria magnacalcarata]|uniref:Uncharacterized protein n=2 Tax=Rotaria magnacalcarata TaxID=392030 RepID=A0A816LGW1_9BILA|nr:unnamed protein product [Rotaria magnacalcarata]